tara:strand:+ start:188 stop:781 length:594 start_codon:yes stop_codon:yes gene_type:complete
MMIRLLGKVPDHVYLACSGGADSMAALDFLNNGRRNVTVAHFNHSTAHSEIADNFVTSYCKDAGIPMVKKTISREKNPRESWEEYWSNCRNSFFNSLDAPVVTAHHLDDACEWWVFTSLHGNPRLIPSKNKNVLRPFLTTPKSSLVSWCDHRGVPYVEDPSNNEDKYHRNLIRNNLMKHVLKINPGLHKTIFKKLVN